jgi:hypothetical protein
VEVAAEQVLHQLVVAAQLEAAAVQAAVQVVDILPLDQVVVLALLAKVLMVAPVEVLQHLDLAQAAAVPVVLVKIVDQIRASVVAVAAAVRG